jgi:hypothetical protein
MLAALDAIPTKQLICEDLENLEGCCAIGAVGRARRVDMSKLDPYDRETVARAFGVPHALACEVMYENDEGGRYWLDETPERRWSRVREWVASQIRKGG